MECADRGLKSCTSAICLAHSVIQWIIVQWDVFIIPNRACPKFSKIAGGLIISAMVGLGVSGETSKFQD